MPMSLYQDLGAVAAPTSDLAYLDFTTFKQFDDQVEAAGKKALLESPSSKAAIATMEKGGVGLAVKLFSSEGDAADAFYELNNSGKFDSGVIVFVRRNAPSTFGPMPHSKPTFKWKNAAPYILLAALGIGATVYYTRRTVKRRRAAKGGR